MSDLQAINNEGKNSSVIYKDKKTKKDHIVK